MENLEREMDNLATLLYFFSRLLLISLKRGGYLLAYFYYVKHIPLNCRPFSRQVEGHRRQEEIKPLLYYSVPHTVLN